MSAHLNPFPCRRCGQRRPGSLFRGVCSVCEPGQHAAWHGFGEVQDRFSARFTVDTGLEVLGHPDEFDEWVSRQPDGLEYLEAMAAAYPSVAFDAQVARLRRLKAAP